MRSFRGTNPRGHRMVRFDPIARERIRQILTNIEPPRCIPEEDRQAIMPVLLDHFGNKCYVCERKINPENWDMEAEVLYLFHEYIFDDEYNLMSYKNAEKQEDTEDSNGTELAYTCYDMLVFDEMNDDCPNAVLLCAECFHFIFYLTEMLYTVGIQLGRQDWGTLEFYKDSSPDERIIAQADVVTTYFETFCKGDHYGRHFDWGGWWNRLWEESGKPQ